MNEILQNLLPTTLSLIITSLISVGIGIYLEKFKNRLTFIKYNILYQPLATSNQNEYWGNIDVYYNGLKTNHLNFITIILENDSNKDYQDIFIDIWVDKKSFIKGQNGFYVDSGKSILLEANHYNGLIEVIKQNNENLEKQKNDPNHITPLKLQNDLDYYQTNSKFYLPVLNRKSEIKFNILAENDNAQQPEIGIDIKHKGLKLIRENDKYDEDKKSRYRNDYQRINYFRHNHSPPFILFPDLVNTNNYIGNCRIFKFSIGIIRLSDFSIH